ncbi:membrane protein insertase YidC [Aureimonas leprariae]|uniref:Membrane protein insertase YidC n=1 Tax=Plantimonas leprariae TaxID=2615207 RepID=A0A7V7PQG9_9HYPH|nr:membrane protein insertase YidC [Aureimonas leprariae]KAB0680375.1 membrane protein insertase YidC [Aureimonas leprariae]
MENNRNFLIAMALSIAVLVGWQFLVVNPRVAAQREAQQDAGIPAGSQQGSLQAPQTPAGTAQNDTPTPAGPESVVPNGGAAGRAQGREAAVAARPNVAIDTPTISGSINLKGARLDDLRLKNYHETVDDASPTIVLLSPDDALDAENKPIGYFAEFGYTGQNVGALPDANTTWQVAGNSTLRPDAPVTLTYTNDRGITFNRTISIDRDYMFEIKDEVRNGGTAAVSVQPYGIVKRFSKPAVASAWVVFEGLLGVFGDEGLEESTYSSIEKAGTTKPPKSSSGWLGIADKYWAAAIVPEPGRGFQPGFQYSAANRPSYQSAYVADPLNVAAGASATVSQRLFAGPKVVELLKKYEEQQAIPHFSQLIDWGYFFFITRPMFTAIDWLFKFTGNFGAAILIVTVVLKLFFFPLANKSYKSMAKMKEMQPKITELRERYADDKMKQQQEMMALYKEQKINPAAGCWPMLVQIPVFFALYKVLYVTIEMRHAPFFGWIQDLAAPDPTSLFNLFGLLPYSVPHALMIGVWPLVMGVTMFVQMRLNPTPPDPTQKMIFTYMPLVFTFMLAAFPAGLVIYWAWNNTLSITQQSIIMKRNGVKIELFDNIRDLFRGKKKEA